MLRDLLGKECLFFDGGTGTVLQEMGLKPGEKPETWNISHPENIIDLHYQYYCAGSNIVCTNTFGALSIKFPLELEKIIKAAIANANEARDRLLRRSAPRNDKLFIAFDISSTGKLLKPMGDLDFEDAVTIYKTSFRIAFKEKIDCVIIETMNDGYETKAAVIAAKETMEELNVSLPIIVSNVYDAECRTLSGSTPETMVAMLEGLGVSAIGVNCSLGPKDMIPTVKRLCAAASVPVLVKPNAGLPKVVDGKTIFDVTPEEFAQAMKEITEIPAVCPKILGGCCGTNPEYILGIRNLECGIRNVEGGECDNDGLLRRSAPRNDGTCSAPRNDGTCNVSRNDGQGVISSNSRVVYFGKGKPCVLIGERINPTGKKKFKEALRNNDIDYIVHQGLEQEEAGAEVLDVNVGLPEINEKEMMVRVMSELQAVTDLPLQIDTSSAEVMEAALRRYNGKALINSVNGKQEVMDAVFPLVKKYGGVVIGLTLDENGIPSDSDGRIKIAQKIYKEADKYGISKKDIIIDPLAMAVSSDSKAAIATMETVRAITELGGNTSLGISNVSFGLPNREFVTSSFFTLCMQNGLSAAIMNPLQTEMKKAYYTFNLLKGMDENCGEYIGFTEKIMNAVGGGECGNGGLLRSARNDGMGARNDGMDARNDGVGARNDGVGARNDGVGARNDIKTEGLSTLSNAIIKGLKNDAAGATRELLKDTDSLVIINEHLIPGLDFVGKRFEEKTMYLPQLLMAAEAAKAAFTEIREFMDKTGKRGESKGKIIIATVKNDIHDIGKNIVKVLLENYGFDVIDLGKDVAPEIVVKACKKENGKLVGLSALMTTTVVSMEETIKLLRKECPWAKVCVGGAVMTQEYANQIGADFYGKDAMDTVRFALELFK